MKFGRSESEFGGLEKFGAVGFSCTTVIPGAVTVARAPLDLILSLFLKIFFKIKLDTFATGTSTVNIKIKAQKKVMTVTGKAI